MKDILFSEGFETDGDGSRYTVTPFVFNDGSADFFTRTDGSTISSGYQVTGGEGSFYFAAQDTDGDNAGLTSVSLLWQGIDVAGYSSLEFSGLFAEDDASDGAEDWDADALVYVEVSFDAGATWSKVLQFASQGATNTAPGLDTNFDGVADSTGLSGAFGLFTGAIAGTGSLMDMRLTVQNLEAGDEDIAFDDIKISGVLGGSGGGGGTPGLVLDETFDSAAGFTVSDLSGAWGFFSDSSFDYLGLTAGNFGAGSAPSGLPTYAGADGSALVGMDLDGDGATMPYTFAWTGLDITGLTGLSFSGLFGESQIAPDGNTDIDNADFIRVAYSIDGGAATTLLEFRGNSTATAFNGVFAVDTNGDGVGDGATLSATLSEFTADITGTGSVLDLFLTVSVDAGDEDFVVDSFRIGTGGSGGGGGDDGGNGGGTGGVTLISAIQGTDATSAMLGQTVTIEGIVVGDYDDAGELQGFFVQEEAVDEDGDSRTSEGIFVYLGSAAFANVAEGDKVSVTGTVDEFFGQTQIDTVTALTILDSGRLGDVVAAQVTLSEADGRTDDAATLEQYEGMLAHFTQNFTVTEYFQLGRYGQIVLQQGDERAQQYTQVNAPDAAGYAAYEDSIWATRIILDDANNSQNRTDTIFHPQPDGLSADDYFRGGDIVTALTGVMTWSFNYWRVQPTDTAPVDFTPANPRTDAPEDVGGSLKVASFNVLNFFTTLNDGANTTATGLAPRGANSDAELQHQAAKIVAALTAIDADVVGMLEIENDNDQSAQYLVDLLNQSLTGRHYVVVQTGVIGGDAIKVGFIYDANTVKIADGTSVAVLDTPEFLDPVNSGGAKNRPSVAVTFEELSTGGTFTSVINHLKSKGSAVTGDPDLGDGQGNGNQTRTLAADMLADWLATNPTGTLDGDTVILGDLNSYAAEDPIQQFKEGADDILGTADDFTDLAQHFVGSDAYSYVFDGYLGTLDYALANQSLLTQVTGATEWHINADEIPLFDYNDDILDPGEQSFEAEPALDLNRDDAYRSSDHDPVVIGLNLKGPSPTVIADTAGSGMTKGTAGADLFQIQGGGVDMVRGLGGIDQFDLSGILDNGRRDTVRILDYEAGEIIVGVSLADDVASVRSTGTNLVLTLVHDQDSIVLNGVTDISEVIFADTPMV